jgi:hypothetical protein
VFKISECCFRLGSPNWSGARHEQRGSRMFGCHLLESSLKRSPRLMSTTDEKLFRGLERQASWVRHEVDATMRFAAADTDGFGIHKTQLDALDVLMKDLDGRVASALAAVRTSATADERAAASRQFLAQMVGRAEVWQVFRNAFAARRDPILRPLLDLADLVAARSYLALQKRARQWNVLAGSRPPPLVVLRAAPGAAAGGARHSLKLLADSGYALQRFRDEPLPIPIVLLSAEQCGSVWRFVSLFHEVGHVFDADVPLSAEIASLSASAQNFPSGLDGTVVRRWCRELVADVVGLGSGGGGFLSALAYDLLELLPSSRALTDDVHPNPWVRLPLAFEFAKSLGLAVPTHAEVVLGEARKLAAPDWTSAFEPHLSALAQFLTKTPLDELGKRPLAELARQWTTVAPGLAKLVGYFARAGEPSRFPVGAQANGIDYDVLPIAAETARLTSDADWETIHNEALEYARTQLNRPPLLASNDIEDPLLYREGVPVLSIKTNLRARINAHVPPSTSHFVPDGSLISRLCIIGTWLAIFAQCNLLSWFHPPSRRLLRFVRKTGRDGRRVGLRLAVSDYHPEFVLPEITLCPQSFDFGSVGNARVRARPGRHGRSRGRTAPRSATGRDASHEAI